MLEWCARKIAHRSTFMCTKLCLTSPALCSIFHLMSEHATPSDYWLEPARSIILKMGGAPRVAKILNIHESAVYRWVKPKKPKNKGGRGTGGLVPSERQQQILAWSRLSGNPVTPDDFFPASKTVGKKSRAA